LPTPIEHLMVAQQMLSSLFSPEAIISRLGKNEAVRGAFFFGHIAPDVQVISHQPRAVTHFFTLPLTSRRPAYEQMLATHPDLARPRALSADRAAFLAGYLSHLLLDECWVREVFQPIFGPQQTWGDWRERLLLHNVLRAWLDRRDRHCLQDGVGGLLRQAEPCGWLPFVTDADLCRWRDLVADQLSPGAEIRTVEIFAHRARIPPTEFLALLEPRAMEERIFNRVPLIELDRLHERAVVHTGDLVGRYMNGCAGNDSV
jgi:hypothetical protein